MGVSTDGIICFGIIIPNGAGLPWEDYKEEEWWLLESGYLGNMADFDLKYEWLNNHPMPVYPVNCCSADYPKWVLAVPGTVKNCGRGYPLAFDPTYLHVFDEEVADLVAFCQKYGIQMGGPPSWLLCSYWG